MDNNEIKQARQERGWSQMELARRTKMHPSTISSIESGRLKPYPVQLEKITKALEGKN